LQSVRLICASVFTAVLLFLSGLHVYWAVGGTWGNSATIPTVNGRPTLNPSPLATYLVAFLLAAGAVIMCGRAGLFNARPVGLLFRVGSWCLFAVFLLRSIGNLKTFGFLKSVQGTTFAYWDTHLYSPLCLVLAVLAGVVSSGRD
jgi:hypothetical protein